MKVQETSMTSSFVPLIISIVIISLILVISFMFNIHHYPFWIKEDGIIESLSVLGYVAAALYMIMKGKWEYIKKYYYFFIVIILFGLRELDLHKKFTAMSIFKSKFYISHHVPMVEKFIGLVVILCILYLFITIIKHHTQDYFSKIKSFSPVHIGILLILLTLIFTKTIDGLSRKLAYFNIVIETQVSKHLVVIEEVLELGIPLLIIATLICYFENETKVKMQ